MRPSKLILLPSLAIAMFSMSPVVLAQNGGELDMTMTIMDESQEPEGFIQKIRLPSPAEITAQENVVPGKPADNAVADQVRTEAGELVDEAAGTVTDDIKSILSIDGTDSLPPDIIDNLTEDLPLLDEDLPVDLPQGNEESGRVIDAMDKSPLDEARRAGSETGKAVEETKNLIP